MQCSTYHVPSAGASASAPPPFLPYLPHPLRAPPPLPTLKHTHGRAGAYEGRKPAREGQPRSRGRARRAACGAAGSSGSRPLRRTHDPAEDRHCIRTKLFDVRLERERARTRESGM